MGTSATYTNGRGLWSRNSPDKSELSKRLGRWAIGLIDDLDYHEILVRYAQSYRNLGWTLTIRNRRGEPEFQVDGGQSPNGWLERLNRLLAATGWVSLGVRTGSPSRLLVLEVTPEGNALLEPFGDWRSTCVARSEDGPEQHFFTLPPGYPMPGTLRLPALPVKVFGEGGEVVAPPSILPNLSTPQLWLTPPWEHPPGAPSPALWQFLCAILTETVHPHKANPPRPSAPAVEWGQYPLPNAAGVAETRPPLSHEDRQALEYLQGVTSVLYRQLHESPQVAAFKAALCEHLAENPDMARNLDKVEMLQYCLYTYCRINPDFADLTIKERVREASKMAGEFLRQLDKHLTNYWDSRDTR